jgi:poly(A) polymerase
MVEPRIIPRPEHNISRKDIDRDTVHVLYKLKDAGHEAYLVGGAVRDLLMGRTPKDYDIATDARPNELRRIFRNSRIIGRRFKLVHVFFGPKNVEVATLRSAVEPQDHGDLYVEDDNAWGDIESDSFRRDFTVNALFYDIRDFAVIDYTGALEDLEARRIRAIGDAQVRFQEDPVRMLRAIKFAARFGFSIEDATHNALLDQGPEILKASRHRITEEIFRILTQANREDGLRMLADYGMLGILYHEWLNAIGEEGFAQVADFFKAVDAAADADCHYPLEVLACGLFLPFLGSVDVEKDSFNRVAARLTQDLRGMAMRMDLPKKLMNSVIDNLRGQLYLLFFHHQSKRVRRFVETPWFDPAWQVHLLAFSAIDELAPVQAIWSEARKALAKPLGGTAGSPDKRDIFSFRGRSGGGRSEHGGRQGGGPGRRSVDDDDGEWSDDHGGIMAVAADDE